MKPKTIYRRIWGKDTWHFHPRCHHNSNEKLWQWKQDTKPTSGELCNECMAKARKDAKAKK